MQNYYQVRYCELFVFINLFIELFSYFNNLIFFYFLRENNVIKTNNNFLWGSETLEDNIGDVKIQLTPQSNLWINLSGCEVMAHVMIDLLSISKNTSVVEIGCGKGLLSLILAGVSIYLQYLNGLDKFLSENSNYFSLCFRIAKKS